MKTLEDKVVVAAGRLKKWAGIVHGALDETADLDRIAAILDAETSAEFDEAPADARDLDRYEILSDSRMNAAGLIRYWQKRRERESAVGDGVASGMRPAGDAGDGP